MKKCCYVFQSADTQRDFQLGKNVSRENVSPKGFLSINEQIIALSFIFFFLNQLQLFLSVDIECK